MSKDRNPSIRAAIADLIRDDPETFSLGIFMIGCVLAAILGAIFSG